MTWERRIMSPIAAIRGSFSIVSVEKLTGIPASLYDSSIIVSAEKLSANDTYILGEKLRWHKPKVPNSAV